MPERYASETSSTTVGTRGFLVTDLDNTVVDSRDRYRRAIVDAVGYNSANVAPLITDIRKLSREQRGKFYDVFLSGKYMDLDIPIKGSIQVLSKLRSMGLGIIYLTGRHDSAGDSLKEETIRTLSRFGFPMPNQRDVMLYMKPDRMMPTAKYKTSVLERLNKTLELTVGVDDEPKDLEVIAGVIPLTIGIAISAEIARQITSKLKIPIAKDWFEVESIISSSGLV